MKGAFKLETRCNVSQKLKYKYGHYSDLGVADLRFLIYCDNSVRENFEGLAWPQARHGDLAEVTRARQCQSFECAHTLCLHISATPTTTTGDKQHRCLSVITTHMQPYNTYTSTAVITFVASSDAD